MAEVAAAAVESGLPTTCCAAPLSPLPPLPFQHRAMRTELASHLPVRPTVVWHFFGIASHARFSVFGGGGGGIVTFSLFAVGALHSLPVKTNVSTSIVVTRA